MVSSLSGIVPDHCILIAPKPRPFECDGLSLYRTTPPVVVLPENEEQVIAVLNACRQFNLPLVREAGTGLSRHCPLKRRVGLSSSIESKVSTQISHGGGAARGAQPCHFDGTTVCITPDPSSQIACSIGGNIAENSGASIA